MMLQLGSGEEGGHMARLGGSQFLNQMFPLGLSLKQDEGHGFLRPVGGHGSEKIFSDDVMKPVTVS